MRHLILHYHIFKNAGTSLDGVFSRIFGDEFHAFDKKSPGGNIAPREVQGLVDRYDKIKVFSSHQIKFPKPVIQGFIPHQVVFLRHPLARVSSCFHFEKNVQKLMDKNTSLEQYVQHHLNRIHMGAIIGLQTRVIADNILFKDGGLKSFCNDAAYASAVKNLEQCATFGIVEEYGKSLELFELYFQLFFPEFKVLEEEKGKRLNVSKTSHSKITDAIDALKKQLQPETYDRLVEQLSPDIKLYERALEIFKERCQASDIECD